MNSLVPTMSPFWYPIILFCSNGFRLLESVLDVPRLELKDSIFIQLGHHPCKRNVGDLPITTTAPAINVIAWKPALHQFLVAVWLFPKRWAEQLHILVQSQSVESELGLLRQSLVVEVLKRHWLVDIYAPVFECFLERFHNACKFFVVDNGFMPGR